ncbi:hypothetical protein OO010_07435 [Flavobacteriaceae bacterium KMM 6898]|nr:hypothetical protein [Flavobacteriaceae bacterium KMM 6898]
MKDWFKKKNEYWHELEDSYKESLLQFFWILFGNIFPLLLGWLIFALPDIIWRGGNTFIEDGQFYIYSVSLISSATYVFWTFKVQNLDKFALLGYASIMIGGLASLFYALFLVGSVTNYNFIKYSSLIIFIFTIFIFYKSIIMNGTKLDVHEAQKLNIQNIASTLK